MEHVDKYYSANRWTHTDHFESVIFDCSKDTVLFAKQIHSHKYKALHILSGVFEMTYLHKGKEHTTLLEEGESFDVRPGELYKVECVEDGTIIQVATTPHPMEKTILLN